MKFTYYEFFCMLVILSFDETDRGFLMVYILGYYDHDNYLSLKLLGK